MRNTKRLVQVHVTDICTNIAGARKPRLGIKVRAVHIDLATCVMDHLADGANG